MASTTPPEVAEARPHRIIEFFSTFLKAKGALSTFFISVSLSFALGCTVAVVPEILSDRYARLYHGYSWELPCSSFDDQSMPVPCRNGADDAQDASAWSSMLQNLMTLFFNPVIGRLSDVHGRRRIFVLSTFCYTLGPMVLVLMQVFPHMDPIFFYLANSLIGVVSYMGLSFAILSDSMPEEYRAPSFGLVMAGFYGGFAFSPFLALLLNHMHVSILSMVLAGMGFIYTLVAFPETLPDSVRENNQQQLSEQVVDDDERERCLHQVWQALTRPFKEMAILNRDKAIRLVAVGSFFSSMVYSTDVNLVIFYIEEYLNVREQDIAFQFLFMGVVGVIIQGLLLQPMIQFFGEKGLLIVSFLSGTLHNFLYGIAKNKPTLYLALCLSQLTKTNTPILASLASKDATVNEQGQLQGALYAVNALSAAVGPLSMQFIYERTKDTIGPGTMFVFASFLYFVGTIVVSFIPVDKIRDEDAPTTEESRSAMDDLEEPLLLPSDEPSSSS
jgi:DHA1 family tetracycline resistance protein-like MFS transporter